MDNSGLLCVDGCYPAWSLSYLIGMMPDQIECEGYNYYLFILPRDEEFTIKYSAGSNLAKSYCRESLFDAITEMIEWLIKEGHLDNRHSKKPKVTGQWACVFSRTREIGQGGE